MAKNVTMKKGESIIKCVEAHVEHFEKNGYKVHDEKAVVKKVEKPKEENEEINGYTSRKRRGCSCWRYCGL